MNRISSFSAVLPLLAVLAVPVDAQTGARRIEVTTPVRMSIETYKLANGLTVILSPDRLAPVVAVDLWYHVGSANESAGRTGFAHLFEHLMFQGSENVGDDEHFGLIEEAGGTLNGSTGNDRTNYFEAVPSNFLERILWLEADRMGGLLATMTQEKLDNQRSVVQNERRQSYENAPYGLAYETLAAALYPAGHIYSWPPIGSMADLNAASLEDVSAFFRRYYAPNNASLAIAGDFDVADAKRWVERYFGSIPAGPAIERPNPAPVRLGGERKIVLEDRVQLPRLYMAWHTPALYADGDAEMDVLSNILTGGSASRLAQRMIFQDQIAQSVDARQASLEHAGYFMINVTPRPGIDLKRVQAVVDEELRRLRTDPPTDREIQRSLNNIEAGMIQGMETAQGRADQLNVYQTYTGQPDYAEKDFNRYRNVTRASLLQALDRYVGPDRVILSIVPQGQTQLQANAPGADSSTEPVLSVAEGLGMTTMAVEAGL